MSQLAEVARGDVIAVVTGTGIAEDLIRIGDVLEGKPGVANHVIGVTHRDQLGRWMGMAGQPGGFGLQDCTPFLSDPRTRTNFAQPKNDRQRELIVAATAKLTGTPYDWVGGISADVADAFDLHDLADELDECWRWPSDKNLLPGHVVCSSAYAWVYEMPEIALACPPGVARTRTPGDWWAWNDSKGWAPGS